jgi:hypothetical protein
MASLLSYASSPVMYLLTNALAFFFFLYLLAVFRNYKRRGGLPYPPGPPSRPVIGNLLDIPKDTPWAAYADMSKKYGRREHSRDTCSPKLKSAFQGDVICFRVFNQVIVVLCSLSAIKDLLEKRGEAYSERPTLPILEMYIIISQSSAMITTPNFQDRYGLVRAEHGDVRVLARGKKAIRPEPSTWCSDVISTNDAGKDALVPCTTFCQPKGVPSPYRAVAIPSSSYRTIADDQLAFRGNLSCHSLMVTT